MLSTLYLKQLGTRGKMPETDFLFFRNKLEQKFGAPIANRSTPDDIKEILQLHTEYCINLQRVFREKTEIPANAILDLLLDCNVGCGEWLNDLLEVLRSKMGADNGEETAVQFFRTHYAIENLNFSELLEIHLRNLSMGHRVKSTFQYRPNIPIAYYKENKAIQECSASTVFTCTVTQNALLQTENADIVFLTETFNSDIPEKNSAAMLSITDPTTNANLLHAASLSGNKKCLDFIIKTAGNEVKHLYSNAFGSFTPSTFAAFSRSLYCLRQTLQLSSDSDYATKNELFGHKKRTVLKEILLRQDLPAFYFLLEWLKRNNQLDTLAAAWTDPTLTSFTHQHIKALIITPLSGAMFLLLTRYIAINENSSLIKYAATTTQPLPFTTACLIESHREKLALKNKEEENVSQFTSKTTRPS